MVGETLLCFYTSAFLIDWYLKTLYRLALSYRVIVLDGLVYFVLFLSK
jgi:hypothetical protein